MVFMGHGLIAAFFMMTTVVAAAALWRARAKVGRLPMGGVTAYLGAVLILCKSAGAALYAFALVPIVRLTGPRFQMRLAVILVCVALTYPMLRSFDLFPTDCLVSIAELISHDRAQSLKFRFDNEDKLLTRAFEKPMFGWGRYGRNLVFSEESGRNESVTDGFWVISIGQYGLIGFLAQFGLLSIAVISRRARRIGYAVIRRIGFPGRPHAYRFRQYYRTHTQFGAFAMDMAHVRSLAGQVGGALLAQARQKQRRPVMLGPQSPPQIPTETVQRF